MRKGTIAVCTITLIGLVYFYYLVTRIPPNILDTQTGPEVAPKMYIIAAILVTVLLLINIIRKKEHGETEDNDENEQPLQLNLLFYIGLVILYSILISIIGYYISTFIIILSLLLIKKVKNKLVLVGIPVGFNLFIFVLFDFVIGLPIP